MGIQTDDCLQHAQQSAHRTHAGKVLRGGRAAQQHAPAEDIDAEDFGDGEALEQDAYQLVSTLLQYNDNDTYPEELQPQHTQ